MKKYKLSIDNSKIDLNEPILMMTLKVLKIRRPALYKIWINKIETLENKKFNEEDLKDY